MRVSVPDDFPRGRLPDDVEFAGADEVEGIEFAVPTSSAAAERLPELPDLRVVQTALGRLRVGRAIAVPGTSRSATRATRARRVAVGARGDPRLDVARLPTCGLRRTDVGGGTRSRAALADRRALLVGYGSVGRAVERRLARFRVRSAG